MPASSTTVSGPARALMILFRDPIQECLTPDVTVGYVDDDSWTLSLMYHLQVETRDPSSWNQKGLYHGWIYAMLDSSLSRSASSLLHLPFPEFLVDSSFIFGNKFGKSAFPFSTFCGSLRWEGSLSVRSEAGFWIVLTGQPFSDSGHNKRIVNGFSYQWIGDCHSNTSVYL
ncbi:hypothetical protein Tco_0237434 [Tanacetum coccineum]